MYTSIYLIRHGELTCISKREAWKIVDNSEGTVIEHGHIAGVEGIIRRER